MDLAASGLVAISSISGLAARRFVAEALHEAAQVDHHALVPAPADLLNVIPCSHCEADVVPLHGDDLCFGPHAMANWRWREMGHGGKARATGAPRRS